MSAESSSLSLFVSFFFYALGFPSLTFFVHASYIFPPNNCNASIILASKDRGSCVDTRSLLELQYCRYLRISMFGYQDMVILAYEKLWGIESYYLGGNIHRKSDRIFFKRRKNNKLPTDGFETRNRRALRKSALGSLELLVGAISVLTV